MLGLKSFSSTAATIRCIELMCRIRKGQFDVRALITRAKSVRNLGSYVLAA